MPCLNRKVIRQEERVERASLFGYDAQAKHNFSVAKLPQRVKVGNASEGLRNSLWGAHAVVGDRLQHVRASPHTLFS